MGEEQPSNAFPTMNVVSLFWARETWQALPLFMEIAGEYETKPSTSGHAMPWLNAMNTVVYP